MRIFNNAMPDGIPYSFAFRDGLSERLHARTIFRLLIQIDSFFFYKMLLHYICKLKFDMFYCLASSFHLMDIYYSALIWILYHFIGEMYRQIMPITGCPWCSSFSRRDFRWLKLYFGCLLDGVAVTSWRRHHFKMILLPRKAISLLFIEILSQNAAISVSHDISASLSSKTIIITDKHDMPYYLVMIDKNNAWASQRSPRRWQYRHTISGYLFIATGISRLSMLFLYFSFQDKIFLYNERKNEQHLISAPDIYFIDAHDTSAIGFLPGVALAKLILCVRCFANISW